jgi:hypothetical protein
MLTGTLWHIEEDTKPQENVQTTCLSVNYITDLVSSLDAEMIARS